MTSKLLSDDEVKKVANGCKIIDYPSLDEYESIEDLMEDNDKIILLYLNDKTPNAIIGHWCALTRYPGVEKVCFMDPYGILPDNQLKWHPKEKRIELEQTEPHLTRLLSDYANRGGKVEYNEMKFQEKDDDIATCGRHSGLRCRFHDVPLKQYQNIFKKQRKNGKNLDELVTVITDKLI